MSFTVVNWISYLIIVNEKGEPSTLHIFNNLLKKKTNN
jgi:hypothetical protein